MFGHCIPFSAVAFVLSAGIISGIPGICSTAFAQTSDGGAAEYPDYLYDEDLSEEDWAVVESAEAYVVEAEAPTVPEPGLEVELDPGSYTSDMATAIDAAPGARAVKSGGAMARSELRVRGLGGPRLSILLDGVPLDDPAGGSVDLTEFDSEMIQSAILLRGPEAGSLAPGAMAGALSLRTAPVDPGLSASLRTAVGSHGTGRLSSKLGYRRGQAAVGLAFLIGQSQGDFSYRPVSYSGDSALIGVPSTRLNNDQTRYGVTATGHLTTQALNTRALLHITRHQSGVAGLSGHPTPSARTSSDSALLGTRTELFFEDAVLGLELSGRTREDHFVQPDMLTPLESHTQLSSGRSVLTLDMIQLLGRMDGHAALEATFARSSALANRRLSNSVFARGSTSAERLAGAAHALARIPLLNNRIALDAGARLDFVADIGLEPSWSARVATALVQNLSLEFYAGRAFRPPTFYEMYGPPMGYTRANPDLSPEDGVEGGAMLRFANGKLTAEATLFGARLHNTILYLNRNAYEVRPENAGYVWRGGGELLAQIQATRYFSQAATLEFIASKIDITDAALPTTPMLRLSHRSQLHLLPLIDFPLNAYLDGRAQSASSSNLYGELTVPAQANIDAGLAWQFSKKGSLSLQILNVLDVDTRVDLHQVPLPGRQFLATLVIGV